ncbi:superoxide dismutase [Cu-Zn]-like [Heterodontus francisci]|uniref:superoxide dismutase [Cu-Zn]-like n=1 Tax=Heterodontus francisci TaxID=7792 RepID=UPI00355C70C6
MRTPAFLLCLQLVCLRNPVWSRNPRRDCGCPDAAGNSGHRYPDHGLPPNRGHPWVHGHTANAICYIRPNPRATEQNANNITGQIHIRDQRSNGSEITLDLHGFPSNGKMHGIHIHEFGDLSGGCETLGGHFNPHKMQHGSHTGDLGNFRPTPSGEIHQVLPPLRLHLHGHHSIVGRSIVIHENEDDLGLHDNPGSPVHGNAGQRLACCVIGVAAHSESPEDEHSPFQMARSHRKRTMHKAGTHPSHQRK